MQRFSVGDAVIFKKPDSIPAKEKKSAKDPFKVRNILGTIKEKRALNFYRVEWKRNGKTKLSIIYAGMLSKYRDFAAPSTDATTQSPLTHQDIADEVSHFSFLFRLNHKINRQTKNALVLEEIEKDMEELWSAFDSGVVASILFSEAGDCEEFTDERGIASLNKKHFSLFMIGSVLWEKERKRCPDGIHDVLDDTRSSVVRLHEGECGACLAADVCSHPCCHDWFLEIGHQLRLVHDDEVASDTEASMGKESTGSSPSANAQARCLSSGTRGENRWKTYIVYIVTDCNEFTYPDSPAVGSPSTEFEEHTIISDIHSFLQDPRRKNKTKTKTHTKKNKNTQRRKQPKIHIFAASSENELTVYLLIFF